MDTTVNPGADETIQIGAASLPCTFVVVGPSHPGRLIVTRFKVGNEDRLASGSGDLFTFQKQHRVPAGSPVILGLRSEADKPMVVSAGLLVDMSVPIGRPPVDPRAEARALRANWIGMHPQYRTAIAKFERARRAQATPAFDPDPVSFVRSAVSKRGARSMRVVEACEHAIAVERALWVLFNDAHGLRDDFVPMTSQSSLAWRWSAPAREPGKH